MADGGDQYYVLTQGSNRLGGALDLDALESYFLANGSVNPGPRNRIGWHPLFRLQAKALQHLARR